MADIPARVAPRLRADQDLAGKTACVTGASKGIGRAIALALASRGCAVLATCSGAHSLGDIDALQQDVAALYQSNSALTPPRIVGVAADVTAPDFATVVADALAAHFAGALDVFVNNAAFLAASDVGNIAAADVQKHLLGGVQTPLLTVEELVRRRMFRRESRIVYISSVAARSNPGFNLLYNVSKSAGESLVRTWANLYGGRDERYSFMAGTTANSVSVGLTETRAVTQFGPEVFQQFKDSIVKDQALPRVAQPEEIADVVAMLCTPDARWITGSVVSADGGNVFIL